MSPRFIQLVQEILSTSEEQRDEDSRQFIKEIDWDAYNNAKDTFEAGKAKPALTAKVN